MLCKFWVAKKSRTCKQQALPGHDYCTMHLMVSDNEQQQMSGYILTKPRVLCSYCNSSVYQDDYDRHVKKCPQKLVQDAVQQQPFYSLNINNVPSSLQQCNKKDDHLSVDETILKQMLLSDMAQFESLLHRINKAYEQVFGASNIASTTSIPCEILAPEYCTSLFKEGESYVFSFPFKMLPDTSTLHNR
jgi:CCCH zinc finger in TRM13 protein.